MIRDYEEGDEPVPGYRLKQFLGQGGFGKVWKAGAPGGAEVALKFIILGGKEGRKEFRAMQLVKRLRHANLVPLVALWLKNRIGEFLDDALTDQDDLPISDTSALPPAANGTIVVDEETPVEPVELIVAMGLGDRNLLNLLGEYKSRGSTGIPLQELMRYMEGAASAIDFLNSPIHDMGEGPAAIQQCDI